MRRIVWIFSITVGLLIWHQTWPAEREGPRPVAYRITSRSVPTQYQRAYDFLEYIKWPSEPNGEFKPNMAPNWDVPRFMSFVSKQGVVFSDVNGRLKGRVRPSEIENA